METDKRSLRRFLIETSPFPDRIPGIMRCMGPFFRFADKRSYPLADASSLKKPVVRRVLTRVTNKPVHDILFVSREHPFERPEWMTERSYRQSVVQSLKESLGMGIRETLTQGLGVLIAENPKWTDVSADVRSQLESNLVTSLSDCMGDFYEDPLVTEMEEIIEACLLHLIALTLYCDPSQSDRVKDLIMLLKRALPLGEWIEDPTTWLVLTA
ncbi:hypothetical protein ACFLZO_01385 [Patescibacteria group bacterium]